MDEPARCGGRPRLPVGVTRTCRPDVRKRPRKPSVPRRRFTVDCRCADHNPRGEVPTGRGGVAAAAARPPGQALACPCCPHAPGPEAPGQGMGPDDASREAFAKDQRVPLTGRGPGAGSGAAGETPPPALARHRDNAIGPLDHPTSPTESRGEPESYLGSNPRPATTCGNGL